MILDTVRTSSIEGNMPVRSKKKMTISEAGADILMDNLSNLYNDPLLAVIREYYANGYDSHKKAGVTRAVEVTLPSLYQPSYIVRDYGTGMSEEFINDVYAIYGESTKRKEATTIGAFGLGSKSGFAIAEQFTVTSFHEGKKISVLFQKGEEGSFDAIVVSVLETDEPNGVIVTIPIYKESINTFVDRAEEFFQYVDPGSVIVNGKEPDYALAGEDLNLIEKDDIKVVFKINDGYSSRVKFVMGGIPYEVSSAEIGDSFSRIGHFQTWSGMDINFIVPLASFNLTGNREGVRATPKTKALLDRATTIYTEGLHEIAQKAIEAATDYYDALQLWGGWSRYTSKSLNWKGQELSDNAYTKLIDNPDGAHRKNFLSVHDSSYRSRQASYRNRIDFRNRATIILGKNPEDFKKSNLRHAGIYLRNLNTKASTVFVMESLEDYFEDLDLPRILENSMFNMVRFEDFRKAVRDYEAKRRADAKALRLWNGPAQKAAPKPKPEFPVLDLTTRSVVWTEADALNEADTAYLSSRDMSLPLYDNSYGPRRIVTSYISKNSPSEWRNPDKLANALSSVTDARFIVLLSGAKTPESLKKHSGKDIPDVVKEIAKRAKECVEKADNTSVAKLNASETKEIKKLRRDLSLDYVNRIEDPDLKGMILQDEQVAEESPALLDAVAYLNLIGIDSYNLRHTIKAKAVLITPQDEGGQFNFVQRYPLIAILQTDAWYTKAEQFEDIVEYLNTKYRAAQVLTATS